MADLRWPNLKINSLAVLEGILGPANLEKIRKVTAKRAFEAHDLLCLLRSYYAKSSHGFFRHCGKCIALQHGRRDLARPDHIMK